MILYYTQNSPFARIARIGLREGNLTGRVEERQTVVRKPQNAVLDHSPLGRVPTLIDAGIVFTDTGRIYACLAEAAANPAMRPASVTDRPAFAFEGFVDGFMEGVVSLRREMRRPPPEQSSTILDHERQRAERSMADLEQLAADSRLPAFPSYAAVMLAETLDFADFNGLLPGWADRFPALARWQQSATERESMRSTQHSPAG